MVGILLAAGFSRRFGGDKLHHRLPNGQTILEATACQFKQAWSEGIAVIRPEQDSLANELTALGYGIVRSPTSHRGMGASLAAGVKATPTASGWLIALADMPFIKPASYQAVAAALQAGASLAAPVYQGQRGHPVGFAQRWFAELARLDGDSGAKELLNTHHDELVLCSVTDSGVRRDIDWIASY